jgi:hypothetical protein
MSQKLEILCATVAAVSLVALASNGRASAQGEPPRVRPGLSVQQTKQAVDLAKGAMRELRKKTEGAARPGADAREYIVAVERLVPKESTAAGEKERPKDSAPQREGTTGTLAVVTSYRYFDDMTVFSTVDLGTGRVVDVQAALHLRTPLSEAEFDEACELAKVHSDAVKELYERFGERVSVFPQFSQFRVKGDPRVQRVVHLSYRVGKRELSYPRPEVNLTTRQIETPPPEGRAPGRQQ